MAEAVYTSLYFFCGIGLGAQGFIDAEVRAFGHRARFRSLGGIDNDPGACAAFEMLTDSPALCADVETLTPAELRAFAGIVPPDVVFFSAPCKAFSRLLHPSRRTDPEYVKMARLLVVAIRLMVETWDIPPRVLLCENVTGILSLGAELLAEIRPILREAGFRIDESTYDCGEIGELAQHRRRWLLVARHEGRVMARVEQPRRKKVRAIGEVLNQLPIPLGPDLPPMHELSHRMKWRTRCRIASIYPRGTVLPNGKIALGDYRDLEHVVAPGQAPREVFAHDKVTGWDQTPGAIVGAGSNASDRVVDPRLRVQADNPDAHWNKYRVTGWDAPAGTLIGAQQLGSGAPAVVDPRLGAGYEGDHFHNILRVTGWDAPAGTVVGSVRPSGGGAVVVDPRVSEAFRGAYGVTAWTATAGTVTTRANGTSNGKFTIVDPRVQRSADRNPDRSHRVLAWEEAATTIAGQMSAGQGAYQLSDPRVRDAATALGCSPQAGAYGVIGWDQAMNTLNAHFDVHNGAFAICDPRTPDAPPIAWIESPDKPPFRLVVEAPKSKRGKPVVRRVPTAVVIVSADGWHREITILEAYLLQGGKLTVHGAPVRLPGDNRGNWIEWIGNAVPLPAARAIAGQFLATLLASDFCGGLMPSGGVVWVNPEHEAHPFVVAPDGRTLIPREMLPRRRRPLTLEGAPLQ